MGCRPNSGRTDLVGVESTTDDTLHRGRLTAEGDQCAESQIDCFPVTE